MIAITGNIDPRSEPYPATDSAAMGLVGMAAGAEAGGIAVLQSQRRPSRRRHKSIGPHDIVQTIGPNDLDPFYAASCRHQPADLSGKQELDPGALGHLGQGFGKRSEEHTSELQSLMRH